MKAYSQLQNKLLEQISQFRQMKTEPVVVTNGASYEILSKMDLGCEVKVNYECPQNSVYLLEKETWDKLMEARARSASEILRERAAHRDWSPARQLYLLTEFINYQQIHEEFRKYLDAVIRDERLDGNA